MIIEVKNIPEGSKVKSINFSIEFSDDNSTQTTVELKDIGSKQGSVGTESKQELKPTPQIPPEMTDSEF